MASKLRKTKGVVGVRCPLKGYTQITVYFRMDTGGAAGAAREEAIAQGDPLTKNLYDPRMALIYRPISLRIAGYDGWNLSYPKPTSKDPMSYAPMFESSPDLLKWITDTWNAL